MTTHTHKVINTYTSLIKQKEIEDYVNTIGKWIHDVDGQNHGDALGFIFKYLHHLNHNTKKSMYEHILNIGIGEGSRNHHEKSRKSRKRINTSN